MAKKYLQIRETKRLSVYDLDGSLEYARDELNDLIERYGKDASLDFWIDNFGDEMVLDLHFDRVETEAERNKRLVDARKLREKKKVELSTREAKEREQLAYLQEKYNG